tara:strand:- start:103 stop:432 length:330 start_codon:yes stop_codon:yes gene_type:complete
MLFHVTVKNSSENFIEESEIQGITNLINNLEDIELIGAWQDNLNYSFYFVVNSENYELIYDLIKSNISHNIVSINSIKSMDEINENLETKKNLKQTSDFWKNEFETERQ